MKKLFLILFGMIFMFGLIGNVSASWTVDLNTGLVSYYKFNENGNLIIDSLGNYNGTNLTGIANTTGIVNSAYDYKSDSEINVTTFPSWSGDYAISVWFYFDDVNGNQYPITATSDGFQIDTGNMLFFSSGSTPISASVWTQFIINHYANSTTQTFKNGTLSATAVIGNVTNNWMVFGNRGGGTDRYFNGKIDEFGFWNRTLSQTEVTQLYNGGAGITYTNQFVNENMAITLISPDNNENFTTNEISFQANVTPTALTIVNVSLYINEVLNETNSTGGTGDIYIFNKTLADGSYNYTFKAFGNDSVQYNASNGTLFFSIDTTPATIDIDTPNQTFTYLYPNYNLTLNTTITDTNLDQCWYIYNSTTVPFSCSSGVLNTLYFNYEKDQNSLTVYANDSVGTQSSNTTTWDYRIFDNNRSFNSTSFDTASEGFSINLTANSSLTNVYLNYSNTFYEATQSGELWTISGFDLPTSKVGNNSINFLMTYIGTNYSSLYNYQNVTSIVFTLYNNSYTDDFLNISFKDEADDTIINASITTSSFVYYLGSGIVNKTYTLVNNTDNYNYRFSSNVGTRILNVLPTVQYKQGTTYPQRVWNPTIQTYNQSVHNQSLYLLSSTDGIYVTFQVINSQDQTLSGVEVTATRDFSGVETEVASGTTSSAGVVTFWLNPDFTHTITFSKSGYTTYTFADFPTQTSYTITLSGGGVTPSSDYTKGIIIYTYPQLNELYNDTIYNFALNLTSSDWELTQFGFNLRLQNGTIVGSDSSTTEGTAASYSFNTTNNTLVYMDYYWLINGNYTNGTVYWIVINTEYSGWSISTFFTDLNTFLDSGIFGLDNFGRYLIIFLILFFTVGIMSYKFGATSPLAISSLIFAIIFFLDVVIGLIPTIRGIPYLLTYISGLALVLSIISEVSR